jgi:hypothetical protein
MTMGRVHLQVLELDKLGEVKYTTGVVIELTSTLAKEKGERSGDTPPDNQALYPPRPARPFDPSTGLRTDWAQDKAGTTPTPG